MKLSKKTLELILILVLLLLTFYIWTLPIQENKMPFGDVDAGAHLRVGDYMAQKDMVFFKVPAYIGNPTFSKGYLWYPPPFHVSLGTISVLTGERFESVYVFLAILCSLAVITTYFFMRRLFGLLPAFLSAFMMIFAGRAYMTYLWAQWPERISYALIPVVILCFYLYVDSYLLNKEKPKYLWLLFLTLFVQYCYHPQGLLHSIVTLGFISALFMIKEKTLRIIDYKKLIIPTIIFIILAAPFSMGTIGTFLSKEVQKGDEEKDFSRLFYWFKVRPPDKALGGYFYYAGSHGGYWSLPLLALGLLAAVLRRTRKDLVLIGWFISLYFLFHIDLLGFGRVHRFLSSESLLFYPLIVIGLLSIPSFFKLNKQTRKYAKLVLALVFIILVISFTAKPAYNALNNAYPGVSRITPVQMEAAEWMKDNLPENAVPLFMGSFGLAKQKIIKNAALKISVYSQQFGTTNKSFDHVFLDYSDVMAVGNQESVNQLMAFENQFLSNATLLYNKNNIKVYRI